ncbi:MAG: ABC transporter substrate-binding protein [Thermodesulfovibrionales bacterium]|nr:ABC transporter substrate-binding protein [Thermodesulfovibrionales bacterium]
MSFLMQIHGLFLVMVIFICSLSDFALAAEPTDQLKQTIDKVIDILKNKELKKPNKTEERRNALRHVTDDRFDYEEMAKRSLSIHWAKRTPQEKKEFIKLYKELLERAYINKIESYTDETIVYASESIDGNFSTVKTKIITKKNMEIPVDYKLHKSGNKWLVYDISIEGVSLVSNYRNQFNKIIMTHSYEELIKRLRSKKEEILFEEKAR